jgi:hypothetical protein
MSKFLQADEHHIVSFFFPKFLTNRFPIRSIALPILLIVFLLGVTSSELLAQQKSESKSGQKPVVEIPKKSEENQKLTLRYDIPKFKAGEMGVSKPIVNVEGGVFSYERLNADSRGGLLFNASTGNIFLKFSDPGKYRVTYSLKNLSATATIIVQ